MFNATGCGKAGSLAPIPAGDAQRLQPQLSKLLPYTKRNRNLSRTGGREARRGLFTRSLQRCLQEFLVKRVSFKLAKECLKWLLLPQISGSSGTNRAAALLSRVFIKSGEDNPRASVSKHQQV